MITFTVLILCALSEIHTRTNAQINRLKTTISIFCTQLHKERKWHGLETKAQTPLIWFVACTVHIIVCVLLYVLSFLAVMGFYWASTVLAVVVLSVYLSVHPSVNKFKKLYHNKLNEAEFELKLAQTQARHGVTAMLGWSPTQHMALNNRTKLVLDIK